MSKKKRWVDSLHPYPSVADDPRNRLWQAVVLLDLARGMGGPSSRDAVLSMAGWNIVTHRRLLSPDFGRIEDGGNLRGIDIPMRIGLAAEWVRAAMESRTTVQKGLCLRHAEALLRDIWKEGNGDV